MIDRCEDICRMNGRPAPARLAAQAVSLTPHDVKTTGAGFLTNGG